MCMMGSPAAATGFRVDGGPLGDTRRRMLGIHHSFKSNTTTASVRPNWFLMGCSRELTGACHGEGEKISLEESESVGEQQNLLLSTREE